LRHTKTIENINVWKQTEAEAGAMKKESSGAGAMKTKSSGAGVMFMKRKAPEPELCHFCDRSAALKKSTLYRPHRRSRVKIKN